MIKKKKKGKRPGKEKTEKEKKGRGNVSLPRKAKQREKKKKKKRTNCLYATAHGHFCPLSSLFSSFSFLFILERKLFGGPGEKIFGPYYLFSFLPTQLNILQKSFSSHFLSKVLHPLYFTSKQIYRINLIKLKKNTHTHTQISKPLTMQIYHLRYMSTQHNKRRNKMR